MGNDRLNRRTGRLPSMIPMLAVAAAVVFAGLGLFVVLPGSLGSDAASDGGVRLPDYVLPASSEVQIAYRFTVERPDVMVWMPCYCGCGEHSGHTSARNCFVKEGSTVTHVQFDSHGANCAMCVGIALDAMAMSEEGRSLREIRAYIDDQYGSIGPGTDTPLPPG